MGKISLNLGRPGIDQNVRTGFVDCSRWPVSKAEFAALVDLGMSDTMIATYFGVLPDVVSALRSGCLSAENFDENG